MITHFFSFPETLYSHIENQYKDIFTTLDPERMKWIPEEKLFDITTYFKNPQGNKTKTSLTSSGTGVLRMLSHSLSLQNSKFSVSCVGESINNDDQFNYFINNSQRNILLINKLSEQIHLCEQTNSTPLDIRMGALRRDITAARCYLADSTFLIININALKWSDAPSQSGNNSSGLTSEEANQLAYLAGQSHKNKYLIIYGFENMDRDPHGLSLNSAMQMLWYYEYGAIEKPQPWPVPEDRLQDFTIESTMATKNLVFRKDRITNNWFHQLPFDLSPELTDHQWISCTYEEYLATANEDIPHRFLEWYELASLN